MFLRPKHFFSTFFINWITVMAAYAQDLPPLIEQEYLFPGFVAISQGDPARANASELATDALHALKAIADHPAKCLGENGTVVEYTSTVESVTTNEFGVEVDREINQYESTIEVRREFAPWVRENIRFIISNPLSGVNNGVRELISEHGCYSDAYRRLEAELATAFDVKLEVSRLPALEGGNWQTFVNACIPSYGQIYATRDQNVPDRSLALVCVCIEHAAQQAGDRAFYEAARLGVGDALQSSPDGYNETFSACFNERKPNNISARYEAYIRDNGF